MFAAASVRNAKGASINHVDSWGEGGFIQMPSFFSKILLKGVTWFMDGPKHAGNRNVVMLIWQIFSKSEFQYWYYLFESTRAQAQRHANWHFIIKNHRVQAPCVCWFLTISKCAIWPENTIQNLHPKAMAGFFQKHNNFGKIFCRTD